MSQKFTFDRVNTTKSLKVLGWTVATAVIVFLLSFMETVELSPEMMAVLFPLINTGLYALKEYTFKQQNKQD